MEINDFLVAPEVTDVDSLFRLWSKQTGGNRHTFIRLLTTPTEERSALLSQCHEEISFSAGNCIRKYHVD